MSVQEHFRQATHLASIGDLGGAIAHFERLLGDMMRLAPEDIDTQRDAREVLIALSVDLTGLLRRHRRYADAIALQHQLARLLPDQAQSCRIAAATLMIEAGSIKQGLAQLTVESTALDFAKGSLLLASTYIWLMDYEAATSCLRDVCNSKHVSEANRAARFCCCSACWPSRTMSARLLMFGKGCFAGCYN